jgi:hypothetical protein
MNPGAELILSNIFASTIVHSFPETGASPRADVLLFKTDRQRPTLNQWFDMPQDVCFIALSTSPKNLRFDKYRSAIAEVRNEPNGTKNL